MQWGQKLCEVALALSFDLTKKPLKQYKYVHSNMKNWAAHHMFSQKMKKDAQKFKSGRF